jgi:hypothetical protein
MRSVSLTWINATFPILPKAARFPKPSGCITWPLDWFRQVDRCAGLSPIEIERQRGYHWRHRCNGGPPPPPIASNGPGRFRSSDRAHMTSGDRIRARKLLLTATTAVQRYTHSPNRIIGIAVPSAAIPSISIFCEPIIQSTWIELPFAPFASSSAGLSDVPLAIHLL